MPLLPDVADTPGAREVLPPAVRAFDAIALGFDARFGTWASVAAQRRAVRRQLLRAFPRDSQLLELGAGTGDDALFLAQHGRRVVATDGSPTMVALASEKARDAGCDDRVSVEHVTLEGLGGFAASRAGMPQFDGVYSNFASLNCVDDLTPVGNALANLLAPGARALLVMFGPLPPLEMVVELARGRPRNALRRLASGPVPARVGGHVFSVRYPSPRRVAREMGDRFRHVATHGIGVFVPPSAAEPEITRFPRTLKVLEALDRAARRPLALLADHVMIELEYTGP